MIERGERLVRIDTVLKLAGALEIQPGELFEGMAWKAAPDPRGRFIVVPLNRERG